ncbi:MAG: hypothetical protein KIT27_01485 [Legionellales bacterium]|nr:hypothetical protein [Legionellales bacterium]
MPRGKMMLGRKIAFVLGMGLFIVNVFADNQYLIKFATLLPNLAVTLEWKDPSGTIHTPTLKIGKNTPVTQALSILPDPKPQLQITKIVDLDTNKENTDVLCKVILEDENKQNVNQQLSSSSSASVKLPKEVKVLDYVNKKSSSAKDTHEKNNSANTNALPSQQSAPIKQYTLVVVKENYFGVERYGCVIMH